MKNLSQTTGRSWSCRVSHMTIPNFKTDSDFNIFSNDPPILVVTEKIKHVISTLPKILQNSKNLCWFLRPTKTRQNALLNLFWLISKLSKHSAVTNFLRFNYLRSFCSFQNLKKFLRIRFLNRLHFNCLIVYEIISRY